MNIGLPAVARGVAAVVLLLGVGACAPTQTIPVAPFQEFHASLVQLQTSVDEALATEQEIVYSRFLENWSSDENIQDLLLEEAAPPNPFSVRMSANNLSSDIQAARTKLAGLNRLVQEYVTTLIVLTGGADDSVSVDADALSADLRTSAQGLAETLQIEQAVPDGYFFGFGVLARAYVENKRRDQLVDLIRSSQDEIAAFANSGRQISTLSAMGFLAEYKTKFSRATAGFSAMSEEDRRTSLEAVLVLNEEVTRQLETLRLIRDAYAALPDAHRGLTQTVRDASSMGFVEFLTYAETLKQRYAEFSEG